MTETPAAFVAAREQFLALVARLEGGWALAAFAEREGAAGDAAAGPAAPAPTTSCCCRWRAIGSRPSGTTGT